MNISRRLVIVILMFVMVLLLGILFWPYILNEIILPISLAVWLMLRVFILSVHQQYYWAAIIFVAVFFLYLHLLPAGQPGTHSEDFQEANATLRSISYWRLEFVMGANEPRNKKNLKRELTGLLVSLYATKQSTTANFFIYDALKVGEIAIPDHLHAFLFSEEPEPMGFSFKRLAHIIRTTPRTWIRRWTGQETAEHYKMIDEVLGFLETSLEIKNDD